MVFWYTESGILLHHFVKFFFTGFCFVSLPVMVDFAQVHCQRPSCQMVVLTSVSEIQSSKEMVVLIGNSWQVGQGHKLHAGPWEGCGLR